MLVEGDIEDIRFRNDENGYSVIVVDFQGDPLVCTGNFPPLTEGMRVRLEGEIVTHAKFGRQFKADKIESVSPDTLDGMVRYLGSGIIKGLGPKTALAIVERFKNNTFSVMENNPAALSVIKGISKAKAKEIGLQFNDFKAMNDILLFLQTNGISLNLSMKIFKAYGKDTVVKVQKNPYRLVEDIDGVGFLTADKIAVSLGFKADGVFRIRAGLVYTLKDASEKNGNTYLPQELLLKETKALLNVDDEEKILSSIDKLLIDGSLKRIELEDGLYGVMLTSTFRAEKRVAVSLVRLIDGENRLRENFDADIEEFERLNFIKLAPNQKKAVDLAVNRGLALITGGPGTGKTTIIKCIIGIFKKKHVKFALMAPTGRAAKRLCESTGENATTIHRALSCSPESGGEGDNIDAGAVIVDEVSMMDVFLTDMLLKRLRPETKLIFVGDKDQLPSVGAGNVLSDILESGLIPFVKLDMIYRQEKESLIILNAHKINSGEMPELADVKNDFFFSQAEDAAQAARTVVEMAAERIPKYLNCDPLRVQVLCPMKSGEAGTKNVNRLLQEKINPLGGRFELVGEESFRIGDKVMHISNNYQLQWRSYRNGYEEGSGIFNGDLGIIKDIRRDSGEIDVEFEDGRIATYSAELKNQLLLSYAITVHKSQGCEFDAVIIPIVGGAPMMMTRNLLYTAITRAKKMAVLVGSKYWIKRMVENNFIQTRFSALKKFLIEADCDSLKLHALS